ncbi:MAG: IMP dehydrogenase [Thermoprotei archaeon]
MASKFSEKLSKAAYAYGFDDLILLPGYSSVEPSEISLQTRVSKNISISVPFVSSPMDTVTEDEMGVALARHGGVGVIHRNCTVEEQVKMVKKVKRSESFIIRDVITIEEDKTTGEARSVMEQNQISGLPVVEGRKLKGIITIRDVRFAGNDKLVKEVMSRSLVVADENLTPEEAIDVMSSHKIEKLPVVDSGGALVGLITYKDIRNRASYKNATRDGQGHLVVGAAISPFDVSRAVELSKVADFLVMDVAHFHNANAISSTKKIIEKMEDVDLIVGSIGTSKAAVDVASSLEKVDGFRVGIGGGSVCTTTQLTKSGAPTAFATAQVADAVSELNLDCPVMADGGIRGAGDIALALSLGADVTMMGYVFAGCKESPGETSTIDGRRYKLHRGMGSASARERRMALDRYSQPAKGIPEGTEAWVPYRGEVAGVLNELTMALKAAMGYAGASSIQELHSNTVIALAAGGSRVRPGDLLFRVT